MLAKLVVVLFVIITNLEVISCECKQSYMTICDSFEDVVSNDSVDDWSELIIGSERPEDAKLSPVHLMRALDLSKFTKLRVLIVLRKINELQLTFPYECNYNASPLKYINFYGNEMKQIEEYHFPVLPLKKFSLVNNKIEVIKEGSFTYHEVEIFDMSDNLMEVIEQKALPSTNATKTIIIKNNKLSHIEPNGLPSSLTSLNLDQNNLRHIRDEVLNVLVNLEEFTLGHNKFTEMPKISHLTKLKIFDISSNAISTVDGKLFEQMNNLKLLDLSNNNIADQFILSAILSTGKHPSLTISLALNRIRDLNLTNVSFEKQKLVLFGNPWGCKEWGEIKKKTISYQTKCDLEFFSGGKTPYCIDSHYFFTFTWHEEVNHLHDVIRQTAVLIGCKLAPQRNHLLHQVRKGCVV